jgi:hypothetical protein
MLLGFAATASAQSMLECSRLESEAERLECYDRVAGRVEEKLEEKRVGTTEQRVEARNEAVAEEVVGQDLKTVVPDEQTVEIEEVLRDRNRRVIYRSTDGRYFRRSSSSRITFRAGETCTIEEGVFSAIFLVREDGKRNKVEELNVD